MTEQVRRWAVNVIFLASSEIGDKAICQTGVPAMLKVT